MLYFPRNFRSYPPTHVLSQPQHTKIFIHSPYVYLILLYIYIYIYIYIGLLYFRTPSACFVPSKWQNQFPIPYKATTEIIVLLKLSTPCILAVDHFLLFQLNAYVMSNTHISHHLSPICFGVCYTIFRETIALLALKTV